MGHRAAGLALRELGEVIAAEKGPVARSGWRPAHGAVQAEGEARMSLAFVLLDRGRTRAALGQADRAALVLRGLPAARLAAQQCTTWSG